MMKIWINGLRFAFCCFKQVPTSWQGDLMFSMIFATIHRVYNIFVNNKKIQHLKQDNNWKYRYAWKLCLTVKHKRDQHKKDQETDTTKIVKICKLFFYIPPAIFDFFITYEKTASQIFVLVCMFLDT